jgi:hypothetical protein
MRSYGESGQYLLGIRLIARSYREAATAQFALLTMLVV